MASTGPSSHQDKVPIDSESSSASSSSPRMSSFQDEPSTKVLLEGHTVRLVIYGALIEYTRQIWLDSQARFRDVATELVTMNLSGEFVILQPHWGPKPHWTVADANSGIESSCQVLYVVFMRKPVRYIVGLVRTQELDYPIVIFEGTERHSMTIFQAVITSKPTLAKLAKSISRYPHGQDVSHHLIDYDELETSNSLTFPTVLIITVDKPLGDLLSDLPSDPVPMFLQIPFAYCEHLSKRAYNLNHFSFQMIHVSRAIRHLLICLVQRIGDAYGKQNHCLGDLNAGGDLADLLRLALLYSRALQALLERANGIADRLESPTFIRSEIQNAIGGVFNDICGDYPGSIVIRYSHTRLEELAKMDREEELQAPGTQVPSASNLDHQLARLDEGAARMIEVHSGTKPDAPISLLEALEDHYHPNRMSGTREPSASNLDHRIARLDEGAERMITFHSGTRPDAPISLLEALEDHYRRFPNTPVINIHGRSSCNRRKGAMEKVTCGFCSKSGKFQKIADHIVCEHFKLTLWYCGWNSCPTSMSRKSDRDRHLLVVHKIARPRLGRCLYMIPNRSLTTFPLSLGISPSHLSEVKAERRSQVSSSVTSLLTLTSLPVTYLPSHPSRPPTMASVIEFKDILLGSIVSLHPYLGDNPRLFLRLFADGSICGEAPLVNGDPATGIWEINSTLCAYPVKQSVTLAIVASKARLKICFASVKLSVVDLLTQIKARSDGYYEFKIGDSDSSIQLLMTCSVNALPSPIVNNTPSHVGTHDNHTVDSRAKNTQSAREPDNSELPSREDLESAYVNITRIPDRDERKARELSQIGRAYYVNYQGTRAKADLERAIIIHEEAMQFTGSSHPRLAEHAHRLSVALIERFKQSGDIVDIERAISHIQTALNLTEDLDANKRSLLSNLGSAFQLRFERLGNLSDLEDAISNKQKAVELTQDGHSDTASLLNNLGAALQARFNRLGGLADLEGAILNTQKAVELTPDGHSNKPGQLGNLGIALQARFDRLGGLADLEGAILNTQKAVELTPDGHPNKASLLNNLGAALETRFDRLGGLADLEGAILNTQKAIELTPDGHSNKPGRLGNLGIALQARFDRLGGLADLEGAILNTQKAVELTPDGHPNKASLLNNLRAALETRFDRLGGLADLEGAILNTQKAVELTPDGHPNKASLLNNLGAALETRFDRLGGLADLEGAILNTQKAIELTPDGHSNKPGRLGNLGIALQARFDRLGGLADLEGAILNMQKAVELTPDGHPEKPASLNNLGTALQTRFDRLGGLADLEGAILNMQKAVELTPDGHSNKPGQLGNLGIALQARFDRLGGLADLEGAILNTQKAVELTPDGHPNKASLLNNLGGAFITRFGRLGIVSDLDSGLSVLSAAAKSTSGSAMVRFSAARSWAKVAEKYSRSPLDAFSCAIDLLPQIAWLGLAVTDQHALLSDVGGIVRNAVAAAIRYEEYETAVVWAEQGRSIVWQNLLGLRNSVDDLRQAYPELANRLRRIAAQLEGSIPHKPLGDNKQKAPVEDASHKYSKLALEWDNLVSEIRSLPTFEGFLKAKTFSQLAPAAHEGPVVILNVDDARCDALVLIADESAEKHVSAVNIPLERFSHEKSNKTFLGLTELLASAGVRKRNDRKTGRAQSQANGETKFKNILRILWQDVVKPVIEGLALQTKSDRPPRIWWCATGLLAFLPIHAAGLYDTQEVGERVSDYVVSSYTPTLTAILEMSGPVVREEFQVLTVAQASAPGAPPIPKTEDEVLVVQGLVTSARVLNLTKENATVERVRGGMMESNWIHLACHGQQNSKNPMESGFLLHDGMLKLSEIVKMSLPKADFAFLSACQTAMGDEKVAEESVHLAAGMLLSGCRGVIATTWSIRDDDAPKIAQEVYSRMFKDGKPNRKEAAYALHEAVKLLRESGAPCTAWVPFIHIGR